MQQLNFSGYSFSASEKEKKQKKERRPQAQKKVISYIDTKYSDNAGTLQRDEMDKDVVF